LRITQDKANWPSSPPGTVVHGKCRGPSTGNPTRRCFRGGRWGRISNPCV